MKPAAIAETSKGIATVATTVRAISMAPSTDRVSSANLRASSPASTFLANIGTKATLSVPSAKKRRNILGRRKAATKASITGPGPIRLVMNTSRTKPSSRLRRVQPPTVRTEESRRTGFMSGPLDA